MKTILVTNDDGIHAPGLAIAESIAHQLAERVIILAPEDDCSGKAQAITMDQPLRIRECGEDRYALSGTPADCVLFADSYLFANEKPDLVLSGVNCGANIGDAVQYSGTVGAALAAAQLGWRSVALSQAFVGDRYAINWEASETLAVKHIQACLRKEDIRCWNLNFPAVSAAQVAGYQFCVQAERNVSSVEATLTRDGRGIASYWLGFNKSLGNGANPATDIACIAQNKIAISPLTIHRVDNEQLSALLLEEDD